ncbi:hypothetical protein ACP4OV_004674 [Aristida adscensionis]
MAPTAAMMAAAAAVVLLVQCCNTALAARPLLDAAGDGGRWLGLDGAGALIMQVLQGCTNPGGWNGPHPGGGCR